MASAPPQQASPPRGPPPTPSQPPSPQPPRFRIGLGWVVFALVLLAINFFVASRATESPNRVGVPYSPFFLNEVNAGHVKEITSKGTAIQGTFTEKIKYANNEPTTNFKTEVPAFANNNALSNTLQEKHVVVNA